MPADILNWTVAVDFFTQDFSDARLRFMDVVLICIRLHLMRRRPSGENFWGPSRGRHTEVR